MDTINNVLQALTRNNIEGFYVKSIDEAIDTISQIIPKEATVSLGGSMTIMKTDVINHIMSGRYNVLDRYKEGLTQEETQKIFREGFSSDVFITGTNALTENGELYNIDGIGNRVASIVFGPKKVIVVCGTNKIVKDLDAAKVRMKKIAAPLNAKRLNRNTPCVVTGECMDCASPERICSYELVTQKQLMADRIKVIIIEGDFGY